MIEEDTDTLMIRVGVESGYMPRDQREFIISKMSEKKLRIEELEKEKLVYEEQKLQEGQEKLLLNKKIEENEKEKQELQSQIEVLRQQVIKAIDKEIKQNEDLESSIRKDIESESMATLIKRKTKDAVKVSGDAVEIAKNFKKVLLAVGIGITTIVGAASAFKISGTSK